MTDAQQLVLQFKEQAENVSASMSYAEMKRMASYIATYLAEENVAELDTWIVLNAIEAFVGGADE